jgi:hypothetical protein
MENKIKSARNVKERTARKSSEFGSEFDDYSANYFEEAMLRFQDAIGSSKYSDLAAALEISPQSVHGVKKRKRIPDSWYLIIADKFGVSIDWLRTGEGEMRRGESLKFKTAKLPNEDMDAACGSAGFVQAASSGGGVERQATGGPYNNERRGMSIADMLAKTAKVLESDTVYRDALYSNIEAFHHGVTMDERISRMEAQMTSTMNSVQARLDALESENQQLRQELEQSRAQSTLPDTG